MEEFETLLDERLPEVRVELEIARAEIALATSIRSTAALYLAIHNTLAEARNYPETFVGLALAASKDAVEFAVRGAVLDLAVRMSIAEQTVRAHDHLVTTLLQRAPRLWSTFREGEISVPNVRVVSDAIAELPESLWGDFEAAALESAVLSPARFKARMRAVRERLQPDAIERHARALKDRRVWLEPDLDGMSNFGLLGPAAACERAMANIDHLARELAALDDETRTLAQLRTDVALDLMGGVLGSGDGVGISVGIIIPVMTMLGHSDEPALLEGYGPIDAETARELTAKARSFYRILTHPITGDIIDVDNPGYRPNTDLDRTVKVRDKQCTSIGCGRPAAACDLDHTIPWPLGPTSYANLEALCRYHHRVKHNTLWFSKQDAAGNTTWTSPTGHVRAADPPPF